MPIPATLYIISAPSGCGKTSLINKLTAKIPNLTVSISYTTRPARPGEYSEIDYYFISEKAFQAKITQNDFVEYAIVHGHYYGTSQAKIQAQLDQGIDTIVTIDWQGCQQIKKKHPKAVSIFILPPSIEILSDRLIKRAQDNLKVINARMEKAQHEMSHYHEYDYFIVNADFEQALQELKYIVCAQRLRTIAQAQTFYKLLTHLGLK
jgi:guanylate kinase